MMPVLTPHAMATRANRSRGFTLIEALVALLALSIGLLGIAGLQLAGLRANLSASWRTQATYLAYDIIDRMRANRTNRLDYVMPAGDGSVAVSPDDANVMVVTVQWDDSRGEDPPLVFTMRSRI